MTELLLIIGAGLAGLIIVMTAAHIADKMGSADRASWWE